MHKKSIVVGMLAGTLLLWSVPSDAGRGATFSSVMSAIQSNNADVIASELERAEYLACGRCILPVMNLLDHEQYQVREVAAWWFARRPAQKVEIRDRSIAALYGNDAAVARNGADALGTFRHPGAIASLSFAAGRTDLSAEARAAAVKAMGTIGHPAAQSAITIALGDSDSGVRLAAVKAYLNLRGARDGAVVLPLLGDSDINVRRKATAVLGSYGLGNARATFETLLASDSDFLVRRNAAWALGKIGDLASRSALEAAASNDASSIVSSVARAALSSLR